MGRPLWLDLIYLAAWFLPPALLGVAGAVALSDWLALPGWAGLLVCLVFVVLAIGLWFIGLLVWTRITSPSGTDSRQNEDAEP